MSATDQERASAAIDSYRDRPQSDIREHTSVFFGESEYQIFGYGADLKTGFHATAYQSLATHDVIIAYRGTDPDFRHHPRTAVLDVIADYVMVRDQVNVQKQAADAFTREMLAKAEQQGLSRDKVTVAGHSLGGALAELEAAQFGLRGTTLNAYGAVDLLHGVPEGGSQVTNFVMAGDPVSAASRHFGTVVPLASPEDVAALKAGRYLDASPGLPSPNPLMAMRLSDHGGAHFTGPDSVLSPDKRAHYERNYAEHRQAFEQFRHDMFRDREALGLVLRDPQSRDLSSTWAHLPPTVRQHVAEYHAHLVDTNVQQAVAHNAVVEGAKERLDATGATLRSTGHDIRHATDRFAQSAQAIGQDGRHITDTIAQRALGAPVDPVTTAQLWVTAKAAGIIVGAGAEGAAHVSRMTGQTAQVATEMAASGIELSRRGVEQQATVAAKAATDAVHRSELGTVAGADLAIAGYQHATSTVHAVIGGASRAIDAARDSVSRGADTVQRAAGQAIDTLAHPGSWFGQAHPSATQAPPASRSERAVDPRHPDSPHHALYNQLHERIPEASERRLLQFAAACHAVGITDRNLGDIAFNEGKGMVSFASTRFPRDMTAVDLLAPMPTPQEAVQQIQRHDQQKMQANEHVRMQSVPKAAQTHQGPVM